MLSTIMVSNVSSQFFTRQSLDRWENEGGRIRDEKAEWIDFRPNEIRKGSRTSTSASTKSTRSPVTARRIARVPRPWAD